MIHTLGLGNFKAFESMNYIPFKKINIFLGPNSSGKSSFIKALSLLNDSFQSKSVDQPFKFNDYTGDFKSLVYGGHLNKKITMSLDIEQNKTFFTQHRNSIMKNIIYLLITIKDEVPEISELGNYIIDLLNKYEANPVQKVQIEIKTTPTKSSVLHSMVFIMKNSEKFSISMERNTYYLNSKLARNEIPNLFIPDGILFKLNEEKLNDISYDSLDEVLLINIAMNSLKLELSEFFEAYTHIGPYRARPLRAEMVSDSNAKSVGYSGENLIPAILSLFNSDSDSSKGEQKKIINKWMNDFSLAQGIEIERLTNNQHSLSVKNKHTGIKSNIVDVGMGTSQLLPIIIETIISKRGSKLAIEEPEGHIHPNAQAKLADLFVETALKDNKTFFIETHSMYLLQQIQILVAEKKVNAKDIGVYYFKQTENGSSVQNLPIEPNGQFSKAFPDGFYDVAYNLSTKLMDAIWED